jgi:hypothetical protein
MTEPGDRAGQPGSRVALGLALLTAACSAEPPPTIVNAPPRVEVDARPSPDASAAFGANIAQGDDSPDAALSPAADAGARAVGWWCAEAHTPTCKSYCVRGESACLDAIRHAGGEPCFPAGLGACFAAERAWCTSWRVVGWGGLSIDCSPRREVCESVRRYHLQHPRRGDSVVRDVAPCTATP